MMNEFGTDIFLKFAKFMLNSEDAPIHFSVAQGNIDKVEQHLKKSDCINESQFGFTPLQLSVSQGHDDISHLLLRHPNLDAKCISDLSWTHVSSTVERSSVTIIRHMLEHFEMPTEQYHHFIEAASVTNRVDVVQIFIDNDKLRPHLYSFDKLYDKVCVFNSFDVLKLLVSNSIRVRKGQAYDYWIEILIKRGNTNLLRYVFQNWDQIAPPDKDLSVALSDIVRWILTSGLNDIAVESLRECLKLCSNTVLHEVMDSVDPHLFCTYNQDIAYVLLESITNLLSPLSLHWIYRLLEHKFGCTTYQNKGIVSMLLDLLHNAFEQLKTYGHFLSLFLPTCYMFPFFTEDTNQTSDVWWAKAELSMIVKLYKHLRHNNETIDDIANALYYAIYYRQSYQCSLLINHEQSLMDQAMLTRKIPSRGISLIEFAAQNKDILSILASKMQLDSMTHLVEPYQLWYQHLSCLSSSSPEPYYSRSLQHAFLADHTIGIDQWLEPGAVLPSERTIDTMEDIYNNFDRYKTFDRSQPVNDNIGKVFEKQKIFNAVRRLFNDIVRRLEQENPLFKCHPEFVGSSREGTRAYLPDEFDVKLICTEVIQYLEIKGPEPGLQVSAAVQLFVQEKYRKAEEDIYPYVLPNGHFDAQKYKSEFDRLLIDKLEDVFDGGIYPYVLPNRHFDAQKYKSEFDRLLINKLEDVFDSGSLCGGALFLEPQFVQCSNITNFRLKWRGKNYKDMTISIDVVPAVLCERIYSLFCPRPSECRFYVFFKYKSEDCFPVDHSDAELKSICELPDNVRKGYAFAKAIRLSSLLPQNFLERIQVFDIHRCLRTYLLKVCLLFITQRLHVLLPSYGFSGLLPSEWAYLLYHQLHARLLDGEIPIWFNVDPHFVTRLSGEVVFQCHHPLDVCVEDVAPCCVKQKSLLVLTQFYIDSLRALCERQGCDMTRLQKKVNVVRQIEIPGLQEFIGQFMKGKIPVQHVRRRQNTM